MYWTLYTRSGCHLCEDAAEWLHDLATDHGAVLRLVNILDDLAIYEVFKWRIPVLQIGERLWDAPLDPATIQREVVALQP